MDTAARPRPVTRRHLLTTAALALGPGVMRRAQADEPDADGARLREVLASPHRSAANRARDAARRPFETLRFFGLEPTQTVVEVAPGGGWYTEILAPYLRERGTLVAAHHPRDAASEYERNGRLRFEDKLAGAPQLYDRTRVVTQPGPGRGFVGDLPPASADRVLTFRNLHNWLEAGHLDGSLRAFFAVLKPGGVLGVEEHRAPEGASVEQMVRTGYVAQGWFVERARAAGFRLDAASEVNANPRDTKDHPHGVWSLPPTLRGGDADRDRFLAIGESDRMTLRLVKPPA
ncbi:class I SAM-dependent methyltransferase [Aquabacterium sp. J223]|uniref:class I SAM-dependent methyltransferase n=1 Tax=Aquabacterium sp. J223 TaxID=2898431 RepID=UPI0021ADC0FD|nr:methyltransferase [Aquabacterium sp. J223]UUX97693.1 methyltransferase [Aquabacterium sp. J223]